MSKKKKKSFEIPDGFEAFSSEDEIHVVPEIDPIEHELSYDCFCTPVLINKFQAAQGTEKLIYTHKYSVGMMN